MNSKILFIYNSIKLYEILKEIGKSLNYEIMYLDKNNLKKKDFLENKNNLIISTEKEVNLHNYLLINTLPIKISDLIEKINLKFLKNQFNNQSEIFIGKYILNLNSRKISLDNIQLKLTEKECDLILFIQYHKKVKLKEIQKKVWHHSSDLETHTVETHIYRIRKKFIESFGDEYFIKFDKDGYYLSWKIKFLHQFSE